MRVIATATSAFVAEDYVSTHSTASRTCSLSLSLCVCVCVCVCACCVCMCARSFASCGAVEFKFSLELLGAHPLLITSSSLCSSPAALCVIYAASGTHSTPAYSVLPAQVLSEARAVELECKAAASPSQKAPPSADADSHRSGRKVMVGCFVAVRKAEGDDGRQQPYLVGQVTGVTGQECGDAGGASQGAGGQAAAQPMLKIVLVPDLGCVEVPLDVRPWDVQGRAGAREGQGGQVAAAGRRYYWLTCAPCPSLYPLESVPMVSRHAQASIKTLC